VSSYVALGDSFTAAPFVPSTDLAEGCFRSDGNYPALIADRLQPARFVDVSCSAATTEDLTSPQATAGGRGRVPPQLRAVTADTDLVTLGIGANDEDLFARLVALCAGPSADASCDDDLVVQTRQVLRRTSDRVADALERLERRAPDATVVLIGYPRLVDADRPCARIPVPPESLPDLAAVEAELDRSLDRAAQHAGAAYVDMHALSRGHEICSSDPWVNGRRTDEQAALAYHPFAAGQGAVAERVLGVLREAAR
jgi:lysophospholipase L1-like esterase